MEIQCSEMLNTFVVQIVIEFVISLYIWIIRFLWVLRHEWTSVSNNETWSMIISDDKAENFPRRLENCFPKWFTYKSCYKLNMKSFFICFNGSTSFTKSSRGWSTCYWFIFAFKMLCSWGLFEYIAKFLNKHCWHF